MATLNIKHFPPELYERLKERAAREHRSMVQQVTHLLAQALDDPEPLSLMELRGLGRDVWEGVDAAEHVAGERDAWD